MTKECLSFSRTAPERCGSWQGRGKESETSCQMTLHIFPTTAMSCMWEVVCSILSFARQRWYGRLAYYVIVPAGLIGLWQGKRGVCLQIAQSRMRRGVLIVGFVFFWAIFLGRILSVVGHCWLGPAPNWGEKLRLARSVVRTPPRNPLSRQDKRSCTRRCAWTILVLSLYLHIHIHIFWSM